MRQAKREYRWSLQMFENFIAWAKMVNAPSFKLAQGYLHPLQPDRVVLNLSFEEWKLWLAFFKTERFMPWRIALSEHEAFPGTVALVGWRETVPFASFQATVHIRKEDVIIDGDFDIGNPGWGLGPLLVHAVEVVTHIFSKLVGRPHRTNPYHIATLFKHRKPPIYTTLVEK